MTSLARTLSGLMLLCAVGCEPRPDDPATMTTEIVRRPAGQSPEQRCKSLCQRATRCGSAITESLLRGSPQEVSLMARIREDEAQNQRNCEATCTADPTATQLTEAESCLQQASCELTLQCLEQLASR